MSLLEPGRLVMKIAGRDAGRNAVIVEKLDETYVLIDGNVRRKKVNVRHLEILGKTVDIGKGSHEDVKKAFEKLNLPVWEPKSKETADRPRKVRKVKEKKPEEKKEKVDKPAEEKKEEVKEEKKPEAKPKEESKAEEKPKEEVREEKAPTQEK